MDLNINLTIKAAPELMALLEKLTGKKAEKKETPAPAIEKKEDKKVEVVEPEEKEEKPAEAVTVQEPEKTGAPDLSDNVVFRKAITAVIDEVQKKSGAERKAITARLVEIATTTYGCAKPIQVPADKRQNYLDYCTQLDENLQPKLPF